MAPPTPEQLIAIIAVTGGLFAATLIACMGIRYAIINRKQREQTKREITAYIAEGSISPEEGERLIRAATDDIRT